MILLSSSIEGLMRLREEQLSSPFSISRDPDNVNDGSPISKWEWISDPLDCPPNERCKPESMVGTMSHSGWEPSSLPGRGASQQWEMKLNNTKLSQSSKCSLIAVVGKSLHFYIKNI
ncbi:hypothetical protein J5U22_01398 [Saccharolobus shibatae]|uniref:Uncharacterized protein n=1 Tax=Saccharolobus shibatae TaxID=2286 RepID=A0A8F5C0R7_9CREN|nr:hypothetical protein J5U22_01398 [Saccharolobus shibatae]